MHQEQRMTIEVIDKMKVGGMGWVYQFKSASPGNIYRRDIYSTKTNEQVIIKELQSPHIDVEPDVYTHPCCFWACVDNTSLQVEDTLVPVYKNIGVTQTTMLF